MIISAYIPFDGFYESVHGALLDDALDFMCRDNSGELDSELFERASNAINWRGARELYAAEYAKAWANRYDIKLDYKGLLSPREYNFEADEIAVHISLSEAKRIFRQTDKNVLASVAAERHTSRSGFASFTNPDYKAWGTLQFWSAQQMKTLLIAYAQADGLEDELELMEYARENGKIFGVIEHSMPAGFSW